MLNTVMWFDAHLDLACLAVLGRDLTRALPPDAGPFPPGCVSLPALEKGRVRLALATIFTEAVVDPAAALTPEQYHAGDSTRAFAVARAQLEAYLTWRDRALIAIDLPDLFRIHPEVGEIRAGMGVAETVPIPLERRLARLAPKPALHIGLLMEGADPIRTPDDAAWWRDRGVCAVGLAWARGTRYARGNTADRHDHVGLTDLGRALVPELDRLGVVHDLSHLSDRAVRELLGLARGPVMASHSNCRALVGGENAPFAQRHLTDDVVREIDRRGGVIGLNLFAPFLAPGYAVEPGHDTPAPPDAPRPPISVVADHADRICELVGHRRAVGLGSDMDGGFSSRRLPRGIDGPEHLERLADCLRERGWSDADIDGFRWRNWCGFWERALGRA